MSVQLCEKETYYLKIMRLEYEAKREDAPREKGLYTSALSQTVSTETGVCL